MLSSVNVALHAQLSVPLRISSEIREQSAFPAEVLQEKCLVQWMQTKNEAKLMGTEKDCGIRVISHRKMEASN